jgi:hypothetical protein
MKIKCASRIGGIGVSIGIALGCSLFVTKLIPISRLPVILLKQKNAPLESGASQITLNILNKNDSLKQRQSFRASGKRK